MLPQAFGLVPTTLLDFPSLVAAVVFTPGCNLRCPWCQNAGFVREPWESDLRSRQEISAFLVKRRRVLQGVVVTGGEPLVHPETEELMAEIKSLGYRLKLDTNGTLPHRLERLDGALIDYVAMDLKNTPARYGPSAGLPVAGETLRHSLDLLRSRWPGRSEVRLTWVPGLNRLDDLEEYAELVGRDLPVWVQAYRPGPVLDPKFSGRAPTGPEVGEVVARLVGAGVKAGARISSSSAG